MMHTPFGTDKHVDEYTDYSCSTSLERLARDVETCLRQWYLCGADRHVSLPVPPQSPRNNRSPRKAHYPRRRMSEGTKETASLSSFSSTEGSGSQPGTIKSYPIDKNNSKSNNSHNDPQRGRLPRSSSTGTALGGDRTTGGSDKLGGRSVSTGDEGSLSPWALRTVRLDWHIAFYKSDTGTRISEHIPLNLVLWDKLHHDSTSEPDHTFLQNDLADSNDTSSNLPFSLHRQPLHTRTASHDLFDNFSTMFGIGQHITLTPVDQKQLWTDGESHDASSPLSSATSDLVEYLWESYLIPSLQDRHSQENYNASVVAQQILSSWLQMALNVATSNSACAIPCFGWWGSYQRPGGVLLPHGVSQLNAPRFVPRWLQGSLAVQSGLKIPQRYRQKQQARRPLWKRRKHGSSTTSSLSSLSSGGDGSRQSTGSRGVWNSSQIGRFEDSDDFNKNYLPPMFVGRCASPFYETSFSMCFVRNPPAQAARMSFWGNLLMRTLRDHNPTSEPISEGKSVAHLYTARHVLVWTTKPKVRPPRPLAFLDEENEWEGEGSKRTEWRKKNRTSLVLPAASTSEHLEEIRAYRDECQQTTLSLLTNASGATWDDPLWGPVDDPISCFSVTLEWATRKRSSNPASPVAAKNSSTSLLRFPINIRSTQALSEADWMEAEEAIEHSVLNPLLRECSFQLKVEQDFSVQQTPLAATQRCVLAALIRTSTLPAETLLQHLTDSTAIERWGVDEMNTAANNLARTSRVSHITRKFVDAMDWSDATTVMIGLAQAEEIVGSILREHFTVPNPPDLTLEDLEKTRGPVQQPLLKSASYGRLFSVVAAYLSRVRSPSSIACLFTCFVQELRRRWEFRESLPNMEFVPGLDVSASATASFWAGAKGPKTCSSAKGHAAFAAYLYSSELADPDEFHCLIGQKLQLFNLCLETVIAEELRDVEELEKRSGRSMDRAAYGSPARQVAKVYLSPLQTNSLANRPVLGETPNHESSTGDEKSTYYDADEGESYRHAVDNSPVVREGARCPVLGKSLRRGIQLFAPYLLRPMPLTDDVVVQRRRMLDGLRDDVQTKESIEMDWEERHKVAFLLQEPKLLSDMSAFKAANPGAVLTDFTLWYGEPVNPLLEYCDELVLEAHYGDQKELRHGPKAYQDKEAKIKIARSLRMLDRTRQFWMQAWDEAPVKSAAQQEPLFGAGKSIEIALDHLETIHPAVLMFSVMAANLSNAYFSLVFSLPECNHLPFVVGNLSRLRRKIEIALNLLSLETAKATKTVKDELALENTFASVETIVACDNACGLIGDCEILLAKALSLIRKLPGQYSLVERILRHNMDDGPLEVNDKAERSESLEVMLPKRRGPVLREYMFRSADETKPCQLSVRFAVDDDDVSKKLDGGGLLVALSQTMQDH